jgi:hypothetical protein
MSSVLLFESQDTVAVYTHVLGFGLIVYKGREGRIDVPNELKLIRPLNLEFGDAISTLHD